MSIKKTLKITLVVLFSLLVLFFLTGAIIFFKFPSVLMNLNTQNERSAANLEFHELQIEKLKWAYLDSKDTGKETVVLVHGFGLSKDLWGELPKNLKEYRIIAMDLPGFGESGTIDADGYNLPDQAAWLDQFLTRLNPGKVNLVGFSLGGGIAARYAARYPEKIKSLVLIDAFGAAVENSEFDLLYNKGENYMLFRTAEEYDRMALYGFHNPPPPLPEPFRKEIAAIASSRYDYNKKLFDGMIRSGKNFVIEDLPKIKSPTLIVWGKNDRMINLSAGAEFNKGIKGSKLVVIPEAGHMVYMEKPAEVIKALKDFWKANQ